MNKRLSATIAATACIIIAVMPFHAFLTVWLASLVGHYDLLRLWKDIMLAAMLLACLPLYIVLFRKRLTEVPAGGRNQEINRLFTLIRQEPLAACIVAYLLVLLAAAVVPLALGSVSPKAAALGLLLDTRFLLFFGVVWLASRSDGRIVRNWKRLLFVPAAVVIVFGIAQVAALPADFLSGFGYGPDTIKAIQTVDDKLEYQRIQSTLRGANPLGAYLVIIIAALAGLVVSKTNQHRKWYAAGLVLSLLALGLTYSRSAWIGAAAALALLVWLAISSPRVRRAALLTAAVAVLLLAGTTVMLRDNDFVQNSLFHTDENSTSATSSNAGHWQASAEGVRDIVSHPLGGGVGSAGPASVYNANPPRIAENYFVQIGQEAGVVGMGLLVAVNAFVAFGLWRRRSEVLPRVLLASLVGICLINLLSHAWTDDTLAYIWWGLAGAAFAAQPVINKPAKRFAAKRIIQAKL